MTDEERQEIYGRKKEREEGKASLCEKLSRGSNEVKPRRRKKRRRDGVSTSLGSKDESGEMERPRQISVIFCVVRRKTPRRAERSVGLGMGCGSVARGPGGCGLVCAPHCYLWVALFFFFFLPFFRSSVIKEEREGVWGLPMRRFVGDNISAEGRKPVGKSARWKTGYALSGVSPGGMD